MARFLTISFLVLGFTAFGSTCNGSFGTDGLLTSRSNPWRTVSVGPHDGQGRILSQTNVVAGANALIENLTWRSNSTMASYAATRSGTGAWNDNRSFAYNTRGQLTNEPVTLATGSNAINSYSFDTSKLGVLAGISLSDASTNNWQAVTLSAFSQVSTESWNQATLSLRAGGSAVNASSVSALVDSITVGGLTLGSGRWYADLSLAPGNHTLAATANYSVGNYSATATSGFSVVGNNSVTNLHDGTGDVTNRLFAAGKTQALGWDPAGRLISLIQRENGTNGFNWTAVYDALGRRLRTAQVSIINGATNILMPLTIDSLYDPQVEFGEIGVAINGQRTWKIVGPDIDGAFGSMQGVGGLEATYRESDSLTVPVLNDFFGNVPATISASTVSWSSTRLSGYGPEIGYQPATLNANTLLADTLVWRSRRADPSGLYCLGARNYEPLGGRFLSPDPLGHSASWDLYGFCGGDPLNRFDSTGRFGSKFQTGVDLVKDSNYRGALGEELLQVWMGNQGAYLPEQTQQAYEGAGGGWAGVENVRWALDPGRQPTEFILDKHTVQGPGYGEALSPMESKVAGLNTVGLLAGVTAEFLPRPGAIPVPVRDYYLPGEPLPEGGVAGEGPGAMYSGETGPYEDVGGHHVHAKSAFRGDIDYDPALGFSISQDYMESRGWSHQDMTATQRRLFDELAASGRPNTIGEHTRIGIESLRAGGATEQEAQELVFQSLQNLQQQGVRGPTRIPWNTPSVPPSKK